MDFDKFKAAWQSRKVEGSLLERPPGQIVADLRRRIEARIRVIRMSTTWYAVPMLVGAVLYSASGGAPPSQMAITTGAMLAVVSYIGWVNRRRIHTQLVPSRDEIDRELAELEAS